MDFEWLLINLRKRLSLPLPGPLAHDVMRAIPVGPVKPNFSHKTPPKPGAVLILLYQLENKVYFPLIKRQEYLGAHSGQVSFPGGKAEEHEDATATALREAHEEIGLDSSSVSVVGKLSDFFVVPSNFLVTPVIAVSTKVPDLRPDPREVARILTGDLFSLARTDAVLHKEIVVAGTFMMQAPHFNVEGEVVWGATAMMLNELFTIVREIKQDIR
jgi:8-oxo-dGTP pyrophosphatase MutT (NUDIX family)